MSWTAKALLAPVCASAAYYIVTAVLIRRWLRDESRAAPAVDPGSLPPVVFFRPIKPGVPDLAAKVRSLLEAARPGDQILLLGVDAPEDRVICEAAREAFPGLDVAVVGERMETDSNPKIMKLDAMTRFARHDLWIVSDCEALPDPGFMTRLRQEWIASGADAITCGYRFVGMNTWPETLDAAGVLLGLWPGLSVVRAGGRVRLTLGACSGFRRADLDSIGGWMRFRDVLAEDNRIGAALAGAGRSIRLSREVLSLEADPLGWRAYFLHQHRVAVTYRVCDPAGYFGMIFIQGISWALLLVLAGPAQAWRWGVLAGVSVVRVLTAGANARTLGFPLPRLPGAVLAASLVETAAWLLSWLNLPVTWGSRRFVVRRDGAFARR